MRDGTCLVTVVAGASFLLLMELSRLGAFSALNRAIAAEFASPKVALEQAPADAAAVSHPVSNQVSNQASNPVDSAKAPVGTAAGSNPRYLHVAGQRAPGPHESRSRERMNDGA